MTRKDPIELGVRRMRRRLTGQAFLSAGVRGLLVGGIFVLIYILADRLVLFGLDLLQIIPVLLLFSLAVALGIAFLRRPSRRDASEAIDAHYDLKERVATSMSLEGDDSPIAEAVREDARRQIQRLDLTAAQPILLSRRLAWPLLAVLVAIAVVANPGLVPYVDIFQKAEAREKLAKEHKRVKLQAASLLKKRERLKKKIEGRKLEEVEKALKEWGRVARDLEKHPHGRRAALVKMSKLSDSIREKQRRKKFETVAGMAKTMSLLSGSSGITREIQSALRKGNLKAAAMALDALQKKLESGEISPEMFDKLKAELQSLSLDLQAAPHLAGALKDAAQDLIDEDLQSALEDLEEAEMDLMEMALAMEEMALLEEALAGIEAQKRDLFLDEEALAALEAHICDDCGATMDEIWKEIESLELAELQGDQDCPACEGEGGDCKECNGTGKAGGGEGEGNPGDGEGKAGKGMAGAAKKMKKLVCRRCLLQNRGYGQGMGGPGRGRGGQVPDEPEFPVGFQKTKVKGRVGKGRIVGELFVKGPQVAGEVTEEYVEIVGEARQEAADALSKQRIPQGYRDFIREYFNSLDPDSDE